MMFSVLGLVVTLCSILFAAAVCIQVAKGRLLLKYSLLWLGLALIACLCAIFPAPLFGLAYLLGFNVASNFVFFLALFFFMVIALSLSIIVSKQQQRTKTLVQELALLEHRLNSNDSRA